MTTTDQRALLLNSLQTLWLLRRLRADRDKLAEDKAAVEERIRGGHDGQLDAAWRAIDADLAIIDDLIAELWKIAK